MNSREARQEVISEMKMRAKALCDAKNRAKALRDDPIFLRLLTAATVGCAGQYERRDPHEWARETGYTDFERCDLLAQRALVIAVAGWELLQDTEADLELFNSRIVETQLEPDNQAS